MIEFKYVAAEAADRGTAPQRFVNAVLQSGRMYRNARGGILYLASTDPDEFVLVSRKDELRALLEDGEIVKLTGDTPDDNAFAGFWFWLHDRRYKLPPVRNRWMPNSATTGVAVRS